MKTPGWKMFENKVAELFRFAGFNVETDILLHGGQTDIVVTENAGLSKTKILIECKYTEDNSSVSVNEVENFVARTIGLRNQGNIDRGYLITNGNFTRFGKDNAKNHPYVSLFTINELYRKMFDFEYYLRNVVSRNVQLGHPFIDPTFKNYPSFEFTREKAQNLIEHLCNWIECKDTTIEKICILGDYGAGKTTLSNRLADILASKYLNGETDAVIPIVFPLHKYNKSFDIKAMITDFMVNDCMISNFRYETFLGLMDLGIFLIIFDGFDEMARNVDFEVRYATIHEIGKVSKLGSKVILTGRQSYFPSEQELDEVLNTANSTDDIYETAKNALSEIVNYDLLEIQPFTKKQIRSYLEAVITDKTQIDKIWGIIDSTYELLEIASRPVLLDMIVKTLPEIIKFSDKSTIRPAKLYEIYTDRWITREEQKGEFRRIINRGTKIDFVENLAFYLFNEDRISISRDEIIDLIKMNLEVKDTKDIEYFDHDIRTCSFLCRENSEYRFIHLTFYEYFLARRIIHILASDSVLNKTLPIQVVRFASEILEYSDQTIKTNILGIVERQEHESTYKSAFVILANTSVSMSDKIKTAIGFTNDYFDSFINYVKNRKIDDLLNHFIIENIEKSITQSNMLLLGSNHFIDGNINPDQHLENYEDTVSEIYYSIISEITREYFYSKNELEKIIEQCIKRESSRRKNEGQRRTYDLSEIPYEFLIDEKSNVESSVVDKELFAAINKAVEKLPHKQRLVIEMHYFKDMQINEIASMISQPTRIVQRTMNEAHKNLRIILRKEGQTWNS